VTIVTYKILTLCRGGYFTHLAQYAARDWGLVI